MNNHADEKAHGQIRNAELMLGKIAGIFSYQLEKNIRNAELMLGKIAGIFSYQLEKNIRNAELLLGKIAGIFSYQLEKNIRNSSTGDLPYGRKILRPQKCRPALPFSTFLQLF